MYRTVLAAIVLSFISCSEERVDTNKVSIKDNPGQTIPPELLGVWEWDSSKTIRTDGGQEGHIVLSSRFDQDYNVPQLTAVNILPDSTIAWHLLRAEFIKDEEVDNLGWKIISIRKDTEYNRIIQSDTGIMFKWMEYEIPTYINQHDGIMTFSTIYSGRKADTLHSYVQYFHRSSFDGDDIYEYLSKQLSPGQQVDCTITK